MWILDLHIDFGLEGTIEGRIEIENGGLGLGRLWMGERWAVVPPFPCPF